jgi:hypothetical protein
MHAQKISQVQVAIKDEKVLIGYEVRGLRCDQEIERVSFYVSEDGGRSFIGPLNEIETDDTKVIRNGKYIVKWDALKEMPFSDETLVFDVRAEIAEKKRKRAIMLSYVGNTTTPLGGRIGQLGKVGWYLEGRASVHAAEQINYTYSGISLRDYEPQGNNTIVQTNEKGWKAYSAVIGATFQTTCNFFIYAGIGYGYQEYIRKFEEVNEDNQVVNTIWAGESGNTVEGVELNGGMIFRYRKMIFSIGINTINLDKRNWTFGFGVAL